MIYAPFFFFFSRCEISSWSLMRPFLPEQLRAQRRRFGPSSLKCSLGTSGLAPSVLMFFFFCVCFVLPSGPMAEVARPSSTSRRQRSPPARQTIAPGFRLIGSICIGHLLCILIDGFNQRIRGNAQTSISVRALAFLPSL